MNEHTRNLLAKALARQICAEVESLHAPLAELIAIVETPTAEEEAARIAANGWSVTDTPRRPEVSHARGH